MSKDSKKRYDADEISRTKEKIISMYKNYGIDTDDMLDEELGRVMDHYLENFDELDDDYEKSVKSFERDNSSGAT
tara:strand:+ start:34797 stop:35021 length:225 start_codon:yes stop_codon:yes gene_type:complete